MQSDPKTIKTLNAADLTQFTGNDQFFRHILNRSVCSTAKAGNAWPNAPPPTGSSMKSPRSSIKIRTSPQDQNVAA
jgi:hypothetical protein